jgi:mRNA interferase MazF
VKRGDLYRVAGPPGGDPRKHRIFVVVSRSTLIASRFSTVICAPVYTVHDGLSTQVPVDIEDGVIHPSSIHCDALVSLPKNTLTHYLGTLSPDKLAALNEALRIALDL